MPQMGVSVAEGTITRWLKQVGDPIERDETLLEISTDKVDTEVPSPGAGVLAEIRVQEGETVEVGTVLAVIAPEGAVPAEAETAAQEPPAPDAVDPASAPDRAGTRRARGGTCGARARTRGARARATVGGAGRERQDVRLPRRRPYRRRARRGSGWHHRHRSRRPGDEEGHPCVHRVRSGRRVRGTCSARASRNATA